MQITLYKCTAPNILVDKSSKLTDGFGLTGALRDDSSIIDPIITIEKTNPGKYNYNYMRIPEFNRWYYINDWVHITDKLWEIHAHVDVLYTWGASLTNSKAIIDRTSQLSLANLDLDDGSFISEIKEAVETKVFSVALDQPTYTLICAGGA